MRLFLAIVLSVVADMVVADPTQCNFCQYGVPAYGCTRFQTNQTCATDRYSLGTTHCGSVKYKYKESSYVQTGFFRGCFDCADKRTACLALSGFLNDRTLLQCEIECCTGDNCNTQDPTLTQNSITVHTSNANGPNQCKSCLNDDADNCTLNQNTYFCNGKTHCGSAVIKYRDLSGKIVNDSHFRGCINCADKKEACTILGGYLKRRGKNVLDCEIQCCNDSNDCNDGAADLAKCNYCKGRYAGSCSAPKSRQICDIDPDALGKPHCGTAVGKYRDQFGKVEDIFYRGCFDCTDKRAACFALGGYFKGDIDNPGKITLLRCDIECCNSSNSFCNTQNPTLLPAKVTVFTPTVSGPALCNVCLENNATGCIKNQQTQVCATDPFSLGTTHCGSAVGRYRDILGNVVAGFYRGCINCANKQAACAAVGGFRKNFQKWTQLECKIECCADDNCNTQTPSLFQGDTSAPTSTANRQDQQVLMSGILAFAIVLANIMNQFWL